MADEDAFLRFRSRLIRALVLACGLVAWQHLAVLGIDGGAADRLPYAAADLMLALPVAWLAVRCAEPLLPPGGGSWEPITRACATAGVLLVCAVPLAVIQLGAHRVMGGTEGHHHLDGGPALSDPAALLAHGAGQALQCAPAVLLTALLAGLLAEARLPAPARWLPAARRPLRMSVLGVVLGALLVPTAVAAEDTAVRETGRDRPATRGCEAAPQREFDVYAIDVDIVLDRFGDHDPYGYMYVLAKNEQAVLDQQEALRVSSALELDDPDIVQVSPGLGQDPIQPLVIRARLGECVVINLTNKLENAPRNGFGNPVITQPGGVPAVSVDLAGVAYDAAGGAGGQAVGDNPQSVLAAPGETKTYRYFLDPLMGEGARAFRSGGDSTQLTAHGLFGTLIAEPAGARWFDPVTGEERTDDTGWSNWEAMIQPAQGPSFREFTIIYHEIGDENFTVRRPLRENDQGVPIGNDPGIPVGDQVEYGRNLPMIDSRPITPDVPSEGGGGTNVPAGQPRHQLPGGAVLPPPPAGGAARRRGAGRQQVAGVQLLQLRRPGHPDAPLLPRRAHQDPGRARRRGAAARPPRARRRHPLADEPGRRRSGDGLRAEQDPDPGRRVHPARLADHQPDGGVQPGARMRGGRLPAGGR